MMQMQTLLCSGLLTVAVVTSSVAAQDGGDEAPQDSSVSTTVALACYGLAGVAATGAVVMMSRQLTRLSQPVQEKVESTSFQPRLGVDTQDGRMVTWLEGGTRLEYDGTSGDAFVVTPGSSEPGKRVEVVLAELREWKTRDDVDDSRNDGSVVGGSFATQAVHDMKYVGHSYSNGGYDRLYDLRAQRTTLTGAPATMKYCQAHFTLRDKDTDSTSVVKTRVFDGDNEDKKNALIRQIDVYDMLRSSRDGKGPQVYLPMHRLLASYQGWKSLHERGYQPWAIQASQSFIPGDLTVLCPHSAHVSIDIDAWRELATTWTTSVLPSVSSKIVQENSSAIESARADREKQVGTMRWIMTSTFLASVAIAAVLYGLDAVDGMMYLSIVTVIVVGLLVFMMLINGSHEEAAKVIQRCYEANVESMCKETAALLVKACNAQGSVEFCHIHAGTFLAFTPSAPASTAGSARAKTKGSHRPRSKKQQSRTRSASKNKTKSRQQSRNRQDDDDDDNIQDKAEQYVDDVKDDLPGVDVVADLL